MLVLAHVKPIRKFSERRFFGEQSKAGILGRPTKKDEEVSELPEEKFNARDHLV
jgi:hypothetical protein